MVWSRVVGWIRGEIKAEDKAAGLVGCELFRHAAHEDQYVLRGEWTLPKLLDCLATYANKSGEAGLVAPEGGECVGLGDRWNARHGRSKP